MTLEKSKISKIIQYSQQGLPQRKIAKRTNTNKNTVNKYLKLYREQTRQPLLPVSQQSLTRELRNVSRNQPMDTAPQPSIPYFEDMYDSKRVFDGAQNVRASEYQRMDQAKDVTKEFSEGEIDRKEIQELEHKLHLLNQQLTEATEKQRQQRNKEITEILIKNTREDQQYRFNQVLKNREFYDNLSEKLQAMELDQMNKKREMEKHIANIPNLIREGRKKLEKSVNNELQSDTGKHDQRGVVSGEKDAEISENRSVELQETKEFQEIQLPYWAPAVITGVCIGIKRFLNFYNSAYSTLPNNSPIKWKEMNEYLKGNK